MDANMRRLSSVVVVAALILGIGGAAQPGAAATVDNQYALALTSVVIDDEIVSADGVGAGTSGHYTFRLLNCIETDDACSATSIQGLQAAKVTPGGFALTSPANGETISGPFTSTLLKSWTVKNAGNVLEVRAAEPSAINSLVASESVSFAVTATAPCTPGTYTWASSDVEASPSVDGTGTFTNGGSDPTVTVVPSSTTHFVVTLPTSPSPFAAEVNQSFAVTVTAKDSCGNTVTSYAGPATLSGNLSGAAYGPLTFTNGVATATVTPAKSEPARAITANDDTKPTISGTSATFDVFDELVANCSASGCSASTANGSTAVEVDVPAQQGLSGFLGLALSDLNQTVSCTRLDGSTITGATMGSLWTIVPPAGYTDPAQDGRFVPTITATVRYSKSTAQGTGVANFVICKNAGGDTPFRELGSCPKKPTAPCITKRSRNGVGDFVVTMLITKVDPVGGGYD